MQQRITSIILVIIFLLIHSTSSAEVYKWADKDGNVHYGDNPDDSFNAEQIQIETVGESRRREAVELQKRLLKQAEEVDRRMQDRENRETANQSIKEDKANQDQRCFEARKRLTLLQKQLPVYIDAQGNYRPKWKYDTYKGKRKYLDESSRQHELERSQKKLKELCASPDDKKALQEASLYWQREEWCAAAKADLAAVLRPEARSTKHEIERYRKRIPFSCAK